MKLHISLLILLFPVMMFSNSYENLGEQYIEEYKKFYPSRALSMGLKNAIYDFEDLSVKNIEKWVSFNNLILDKLSNPNTAYVKANKIDARLIKFQINAELEKWQRKKIHQNSLSIYTSLINNASDAILKNEFLTHGEKVVLLCERWDDVINLCSAAEESLNSGEKSDLEKGLKVLDKSISFYNEEITDLTKDWRVNDYCENYEKLRELTANALKTLRDHVETKVLPKAYPSTSVLGEEEYARQLAIYTDSDLTPEQLEHLAMNEIETVKQIMAEVSEAYLIKAYPQKSLPESRDDIIKAALVDMEKDVPASATDCLAFWIELKDAAIEFIEKNEIATLPEYQTLQILPAPESAGPAARIGWVASARPFDPNPVTTLYLPSIPETFPEQEQIDFWASFNKPFTRMIVIHELFPGHYMQNKIIRETPHHVRLFFPYALYSEGYATFTEKVLLDAGWEKDNPLTYLAHLRKRLENANRAYTSVQFHCNNWTAEQIMEFSTETSLVAPQFAKSLWGRLAQSPMQVTSYFLGSHQFNEIFEAEKERLGDQFVLKEFMDTILRSGPIPMDEFPAIFKDKMIKVK